MCRNIRQLHNFEPPASEDEVHDAALQYVRKVSGFRAPAPHNTEAFDAAVAAVTAATRDLLDSLVIGGRHIPWVGQGAGHESLGNCRALDLRHGVS